MRRLNLCLSNRSRKVESDELIGIETPESTSSWCPIPHTRLVNLLTASLPAYGLSVVNQVHAVYRDGLRYFGLFQVENGDQHADYSLVFGLRNSHDKSFPAGICLGSGVFVCDNLAFSSEVVVGRRHTRFINRDLPGLVQKAVGKLVDMRTAQDTRIKAYKETELVDSQAHDVICRALRGRAINATRVPKVLDQWHAPDHPEFAQEKTGWRLFNAFTETLKGSSMVELPTRTQKLHGLFDTVCNAS